ncbi:lon-related putative ATP-dependent protease [Clostridium cavendishii DSM 21758]|uniref:endopeptidase La n=1 Tax=Clostridium cavendishii DSM 21758 TaxID=1121302 RepID=A0A1M6AQM2_9CLOT|nr:AAA family ATPase [Clostridium cavendishii]SHI38814.1 lon-related putative ATP-dependent protease [Clostridium cavendishii DSM 21758]
MKRELTPQEIVYNENFTFQMTNNGFRDLIPEYLEIYKSIETALNINKEGFNVYLIDSFSKEKLDNIMSYIDELLKKREKPKDICYVTLEDQRYPKAIFLNNGDGELFKDRLEGIKNFYFDKIFLFYNSSSNKEKETIIDEVQRKRNDYIGSLIKQAKDEGFDLKATTSGFAFIPLKEGEAMTEKEYDDLEELSKEDIVDKAGKLKEGAEDVLEQLKDIELSSIEKLKEILKAYLTDESMEIKEDIKLEFKQDEDAYNYLIKVCELIEKELVDNYTMNFEDDEDKVNDVIAKFMANVIVDNSKYDHPRVIFEEDPTVNNLIGNIEYENHNGVYSTDVSLITGGSLLNANEGSLIIRMTSLLNNPGSYYYLRKTLMNNKVSYDYNRGYLEFLSLNGLKPMPISVNVKVIIIGDYETYDALYSLDEDFKKLFRIKTEFNSCVDITDNNKICLINFIENIIKENKILDITNEGINEIGKYFSRKAGSRNKILLDLSELNKILVLSDNKAKENGKSKIDAFDVIEVSYKSELIEKEYIKMYKEKKVIVNVRDRIVGCINGLSVIDTGYFSFGKPLRLTCVCLKGTGRIVDVHKESNLSGNIHDKSINILRGLLNKFLNIYERVPVDFNVSFEQIYGKLEGDSASVAEIMVMLSALSKVPIRQNIAVTGSLNQFGEVQPIGGVNDKIEGFFKVCQAVDTINSKGVLIPESNKDELVLTPEVEEAVKKGVFHIYTMKDINDAIEILMLDQSISLEDLVIAMQNELSKYNKTAK